MKRLLIPLLAAIALPTAVYSSTKIEPEPKSQILNNPYERLEVSIMSTYSRINNWIIR